MSNYDTIVIGAGLAGLTAAGQLAQVGQKVLLVAQGEGALLLSSGAIDVLGFQPVDSIEPVENPAKALPDFLAGHPDHPYQRVGMEGIRTALDKFKALVNGSLAYQGDLDRNWLLPGTAGALHPTCLAPESMIGGQLDQRGRILLVGFRELRDFYPSLISENLNEQKLGVQAHPLMIDAPAPIAGKMNVTPIELARAFEQPDFRQQVAAQVKKQARGYGRIGLPAVLGLEQHAEVLADVQRRLGKPVFEINTLPPSVPGRRLFDALKNTFSQAGGRLIIGGKVVGGTISQGRVTQIRVETVSRLKPFSADNYVLATGGIFGGGIQTDDTGRVWEPLFGLPVQATNNRHQWFAPKFLAAQGQPVAGYGIRVDEKLNPIDEAGTVVAQNLFVAGASLAGSDWISARTGNGVALATAAAIAQHLL